MKLALPAMVLSLAANAFLAAVVVRKAPEVFHASSWRLGSHLAPLGQAEAAKAKLAAEASKDLWRQFATNGDWAGLVNKLRAAGFPPEVIRGILFAQLDHEYAAKRKELMASAKDIPYWKRTGWSNFDPKLNSEMRDLRREETDTIRRLLGPDALADSDNETNFYYRSQFGDLAPETMQKARDIVQDYQDLRSKIYADAGGGYLMPSDRKQLAYLQQEQVADLSKVMTPDEVQQYLMRSSDTASQLRNRLQAFGATEDEFKALFQIQYAADQQNPPPSGMMSPEQQAAWKTQQDAVNAQIAAALGPDRYTQYKEDTNQSFLAAARVANRLNLPDNSAAQVYAVQQDVTQRANAVRSNTEIAAGEKTAQLTALANEAQSKVSAILGPEGTQAYQSQGGYWMMNLRPRVRTSAPHN